MADNQFNQEFEQVCLKARDLDAGALNPSIQTFDAWLARNKKRIPIE